MKGSLRILRGERKGAHRRGCAFYEEEGAVLAFWESRDQSGGTRCIVWRGESGGCAHTEEDDMAIESVFRRFGSCGEVRHRSFASGWVDEDEQSARSCYAGALSIHVECHSRIAWHASVPLQEKRLNSSYTRISSGPS